MAENVVIAVNPDGTPIGSSASATQPVSGTVTSNAGTGPSVANSWNMRITDGVDIAPVSTATGGNQLLVSTGSLSSGVTLNAVAVNTTGTTIDFGSGKANVTAVAVYTGTITGTLTLELSVDNTNFVSSTITFTLPGAAGSTGLYSIGRPARYARVSLSGQGGTGSVTVNVMGG